MLSKVNSILIFSWLLIIVQVVVGKRAYSEKVGESCTQEELDSWEAPEKIRRDFNYYQAGRDFDGQPVFVIEFGRWPVRNIFQNGSEEDQANLDKYIEQLLYRMNVIGKKSVSDVGNNFGTGNFVMLVDLDGFDARELANVKSLRFLFGIIQRFSSEYAEHLDYLFAVNVNFLAETFITFVKPALGDVSAKLDTEGTNRNKWIPKLLKKIPRESLPSWYGGVENYRPIAVYG